MNKTTSQNQNPVQNFQDFANKLENTQIKLQNFNEILDEKSIKQFKYLKNVFVTSSIHALQSESIGPWIRLKEVLHHIAPFHLILIKSKKVYHYIQRLHNYLETHNEIATQVNIQQDLIETFQNIDFQSFSSKSISQINSRSTTNLFSKPKESPIVHNESKIVFDKLPLIYNENVFIIGNDDLKNRIYEPRPLLVTDIQKHLPRVVSDLTKLESVWKNALGITLTSINTNLPEDVVSFNTSSQTESYCSTPASTSPSKSVRKKHKSPKTGREVVEYLVQTNQQNNVDIWYLDYVQSKRYEPYNLVVSSKKNVKKEHVVISIFGVLYIKKNGESEIVPLGQWYMEAVCFETITSIRFFKNYLTYKTFKKLKRNVTYGNFLRITQAVSKQYLYCIPSVPQCMLEIQKLIVQINSASIIPKNILSNVTLAVFRKHFSKQAVRFNKLTSQLITFSQKIINNCHFECQEYYEYCQAQLNAMKNNMKASMAITRKQTEFQEKNLKAALENLIKLNNLVKLVQFQIHSRLVSLLSSQIDSFIGNFIESEGAAFIVFLDIGDEGIIIIPPITSIRESIEKSFLTALSSISDNISFQFPLLNIQNELKECDENIERLSELYNILFPPSQEEYPQQVHIMEKSKSFVSSPTLVEAIYNQEVFITALRDLKNTFDESQEHCDLKLEELSWITNVMNFLKKSDETVMLNWVNGPANFIEKQMKKVHSWLSKLNELIHQKDSINRFIIIDYTHCQTKLLPELNKFIQTFSEFLSRHTWKKSIELIKFLKMHIKKLTDPPTEIDMFTQYYTYIESVSDVVKGKEEEMEHVKAIFEIIKQSNYMSATNEEDRSKELIIVWERFIYLLQTGKDHVNATKQSAILQIKQEMKKLVKACLDITKHSTSGKFLNPDEDMIVIVKELKSLSWKFNVQMEKLKSLNEQYKLLTSQEIHLNDVHEEEKKMVARFELWKYLEVASRSIKEWRNTYFSKLNTSKMLDKLNQWKSACIDLSVFLPDDDKIIAKFKMVLEEFKEQIPILKELSNPILLPRHWKEIFVILGQPFDETKLYCINDILSMDVLENFTKIKQICAAAISENKLYQCLYKLIKSWEKKEFRFAKKLDDRKKTSKHDFGYKLSGISDMIFDLEDSLVTLQSMLVSPHIADNRDLASLWSSQLQEIKEILSLWTVVQLEWSFLCNVFSNESMQRIHSSEYNIFTDTNDIFKQLIQGLMNESKVLNVLGKKNSSSNHSTNTSLKQMLNQISTKQSIIIEKLEHYLLEIQDSFPRLYFLSKNEILNLLAITRNPPTLVPFIRKCFPSVENVKFQLPSYNKTLTTLDMSLNVHLLEATGFSGYFGEEVDFEKPFSSSSTPAAWLKTFQLNMKQCVENSIFSICKELGSLNCLIESAVSNSGSSKFLFQAMLISFDMKLYNRMEAEIKNDNLNVFLLELERENKNILEILYERKEKLTKRHVMLMQNFITKFLCYRDMCKVLEKKDEDSFEFQSIYHYEMNSENLHLLSLHGSHEYGYEYLSPHSYFITTPFISKYLISLLNMFSSYQVACISGGSNTGKKTMAIALSRMTGRNLASFNCSSDKSVSNIQHYFFGALLSGSFLCIESLEKLSVNVLSVIGDFMSKINEALCKDQFKAAVRLADHKIDIHKLYMCCVTSDANVLGNWKVIPDNIQEHLKNALPLKLVLLNLIQSWLILSHFKLWEDLSYKLYLLHQKFKNFLSVRHFKSIVLSAEAIAREDKGSHSEESYIVTELLKLSCDNNMLNAIKKDIEIIFSKNVQSIKSNIADFSLVESVTTQLKSDQLIPKTSFINKVLELHEILSHHQSVILYGASCSGKSTCYQVLSKALCQFYSPWSQTVGLKSQSFEQVNLNVVYPNVFQYDQLYGYSQNSSSWKDGILTKLLRAFNVSRDSMLTNNKAKKIKQWLVLDGQITSSWVVPLNSLLGTSNAFTYGNGEKISLNDNCKIIFETVDLSSTPPSLLSKCQLLYFQCEKLVDWRCLFDSWKLSAYNKYNIPSDGYNIVEDVLSYTLQPTINFVDKKCEKLLSNEMESTSTIVICCYVLKIFSAILSQWKSRDESKQFDDNKKIDDENMHLVKFICHALAYAFAHSFPPLVCESSVSILDTKIRQLFSTCPHCPVIFPALMQDCYFDGQVGELSRWNSSKFDLKVTTSSSYILTEEMQKHVYLSNLLLSSNEHLMVIGPIGCGKSVLVKKFLSSLYPITDIQNTPALSVEFFQELLKDKIKSFMEQQSFNVKLQARRNCNKKEKIKFFIDDVNMRKGENQSDENCIIEQIQHVIAEGGFHDCTDKYFHHISNIQFIASMTPPSTDFVGATHTNTKLTAKFMKNFSIINFSSLTHGQLQRLFTKQCQNWMDSQNWIPWKKPFAKVLTNATLSVYEQIKRLNVPQCLYPSLVFSQHDLAKVFKLLYQFVPNDKTDVVKYIKDMQNIKKRAQMNDIESSINVKTFIEESVSDMLMENVNPVVEVNKSNILSPFEEFFWHWREIMNLIFNSCNHAQKDIDEIINLELSASFLISEKEIDDVNFEDCFKNDQNYPHAVMSCCKVNKSDSFCLLPRDIDNQVTCKMFTRSAFENILQSMCQKKNIDLVLHEDLIRKTEKLIASITSSGGHSILLSIDGWGRQKVVQLAAVYLDYQFFELNEHKNNCVMTVLKDACSLAGLKGKPVVVYASPFISKDVYKYLFSILHGGTCHGLFTSSELSLICGQFLRGNVSNSRNPHTTVMQVKFFSRIKQNLRIVFGIECEDSLKIFQHNSPLIYKTFSKIEFVNLTCETMKEFTYKLIEKHYMLGNINKGYCDEKDFNQISLTISEIYILIRKHYILKFPNSKDIKIKFSLGNLVEAVSLFFKFWKWRRRLKEKELEEFEACVNKIQEVKKSIKEMNEKMKQLKPCLEQKHEIVKENESIMKNIQEKFSTLKDVCFDQLYIIEELKTPCEKLRKEAQLDFEKASPLYNAAVTAVNAIDQSTIDELKSYPDPPDIVRDVVSMLAVMFNEEEINWRENRLMLMRDNFLNELHLFDKDNMAEAVYKQLTTFITTENYSEDIVENVSKAAYHLLQWLRAIHSYVSIMRKLKPIRDKLQTSEDKVTQAENVLIKKKSEYNETKELLETAINNYKESVKDYNAVNNDIQKLESSKEAAEKLLRSMHPFTDHWVEKVKLIKQDISSCVVHSVCTSMEYCFGNILQEDDWLAIQPKLLKICNNSKHVVDSKEIICHDFFDSSSQQKLCLKILKSNDVFAFNRSLCVYALARFGNCFPLIVDPDGIAEKWISLLESEDLQNQLKVNDSDINVSRKESFASSQLSSNLQVIDASFELTDEKLEEILMSTDSLLIKNIEKLTVVNTLSELLRSYSAREKVVSKFRGSDIKENRQRVYLMTSLEPEFEIATLPYHKMTPIKIHVGQDGLQDQILTNILSVEKPELELKRQRIKSDLMFIDEEKNSILDSISSKILSIEGCLLDDERLSEYMSFQRETYWLIGEKLAEFKRIKENLINHVKDYEAFSQFAVSAYFTLKKLEKINSFYYLPLEMFHKIFAEVLEECKMTKAASSCTLSRMDEAKYMLKLKLYQKISSLLHKDDVMFLPFLLVVEEMMKEKTLSDDELLLFVKSFHWVDEQSYEDINHCEKPEWLSEKSWKRFTMLEHHVVCFKDLTKEITKNSLEWKEFFQLKPLLASPPTVKLLHINTFQLALLWLAYDPSLINIICEELFLCKLGPNFISINLLNMKDIMQFCEKKRFNMILLPQENCCLGPVPVIEHLANEMKVHCEKISLGDSSTLVNIQEKIQNAMKEDFWLVLQNAHLIERWSQEDINIMNAVTNKHTATQLRVWLISRDRGNIPSEFIHCSDRLYWKPSDDLIKQFTNSNIKSMKDNMIPNEPTKYRSSQISAKLQSIYTFTTKESNLKSASYIREIIQRFNELKRNFSNLDESSNMIGYSIIHNSLQVEWQSMKSQLDAYISKLCMLVDMMENKVALREDLMTLWREISNNTISCEKNVSFSLDIYCATLSEKSTYLKSLMEASSCSFDLKYFDDPRDFIQAIHMQLIKNNTQADSSLNYLHGKLVESGTDLRASNPQQVYLCGIKTYGHDNSISSTTVSVKLSQKDVESHLKIAVYEDIRMSNELFSIKCSPLVKHTIKFVYVDKHYTEEG